MKNLKINLLFAPVLALTCFGMSLFATLEAKTLPELCNRLNTADGIISCIQAANGQACDEEALNVCNRLNTQDGIISCVGAVAGKTYESSMITLCNRLNTQDGLISCLSAAGTRKKSVGYQSELRAIARILRDIIEDDTRAAEEKLRRLERTLDSL